jgi:hypothetical protein
MRETGARRPLASRPYDLAIEPLCVQGQLSKTAMAFPDEQGNMSKKI